MTILEPRGSLRSHNSLSNFNMSTRLSNAWPQRKKNSRNVLIIIAPRQERCQCQYGGCTTLSVMKTGAAIGADVHLAERCTVLQKRANAHYGVGRKNARLTVNRAARPRERARPMGTLSAHSVIQSFLTGIKKGSNVQRSMAQQSGCGRI